MGGSVGGQAKNEFGRKMNKGVKMWIIEIYRFIDAAKSGDDFVDALYSVE